jgi:hypothetical protein
LFSGISVDRSQSSRIRGGVRIGVGSSPFIRSKKPRKSGVLVCRHDYVRP